MGAKVKRIKDKVAIHDIKKIGYCEMCGNVRGLQAHHAVSKGSGGPDHKLNLICLCWKCHAEVHAGNIGRARVWQIIDRREGVENAMDMVGEMMK